MVAHINIYIYIESKIYNQKRKLILTLLPTQPYPKQQFLYQIDPATQPTLFFCFCFSFSKSNSPPQTENKNKNKKLNSNSNNIRRNNFRYYLSNRTLQKKILVSLCFCFFFGVWSKWRTKMGLFQQRQRRKKPRIRVSSVKVGTSSGHWRRFCCSHFGPCLREPLLFVGPLEISTGSLKTSIITSTTISMSSDRKSVV